MNNVLSHIFEVCELTHLSHVEIEIGLLWDDLNNKVWIQFELTDHLSLDAKLTGVVNRKQERGI